MVQSEGINPERQSRFEKFLYLNSEANITLQCLGPRDWRHTCHCYNLSMY